MRLAIVGSREFQQPKIVIDFVNLLPHDWVIVSGRGGIIDKSAEQAADARQMDKMIFPAEWDKHGKQAGFIRNQFIVDNCLAMVAFWDEKSRGTKDSIDKMTHSGKPLFVLSDKTLWDHDDLQDLVDDIKAEFE